MPPPLRPDTNRSFAFAVVEFTVTDATAGATASQLSTVEPIRLSFAKMSASAAAAAAAAAIVGAAAEPPPMWRTHRVV